MNNFGPIKKINEMLLQPSSNNLKQSANGNFTK